MDQSQQVAIFYSKATLELHSIISSENKEQLAQQFFKENEISWIKWLDQIKAHSSNELTTLSLVKFAKQWLHLEGTPTELFCSNFNILLELTDCGSDELHNLALVFIRDFICPLFDGQQFLSNVPDQLLSELFGVVISSLHSPATGTAQTAKQALLNFARTKGGHQVITNKSEGLFTLFEKGLTKTDSIVQIRFMVVMVELANLQQEYFQILKPAIQMIIQKIMTEEDLLVKLNMIELIPLLAHTSKGRLLMRQVNFLERYLLEAGEDPFGLVDHTIILLIANLISHHLDQFSHLLNEKYLIFLFKNGKSSNQIDRKCFIESLGLIFQNKGAYSKLYEAQGLLQVYLSLAQSTIESEKILIFGSLSHLFQISSDQDLKEEEKVFKLFSNIGGYSQAYNIEKLVKSIQLLISATDVPFEDQELAVLNVLNQLIGWKTGYSLIFRSSKTLSYLLTRTVKAKEIVELKFKVIEKILTNPRAKEIDQGMIQQFKKYHMQGVYGELAEKAIDPSLVTEIS